MSVYNDSYHHTPEVVLCFSYSKLALLDIDIDGLYHKHPHPTSLLIVARLSIGTMWCSWDVQEDYLLVEWRRNNKYNPVRCFLPWESLRLHRELTDINKGKILSSLNSLYYCYKNAPMDQNVEMSGKSDRRRNKTVRQR